MYISRLVRNRDLNQLFHASTEPEIFPFSKEKPYHRQGRAQQGHFEQQTPHVPDDILLQPGYVEVQVQACGLTREGILVITGSDYPTTFSHEVGDIVSKLGPGVSNLVAGDRVVGLHAECFAS